MSNKHKKTSYKKNKEHKKDKKNKEHKRKEHKNILPRTKSEFNVDGTSLYTSDTNTESKSNINFEQQQINPVCNSYPLGNLGYNLPNPHYSVQTIRRPDDNKYFHNYRYSYSVQVKKPTLTYDNYIANLSLKNMSEQECRYYAKLNQKYYYYNGHYDIEGNKPNVVALQANLNYPMYMGGPSVGEINGQAGYTPQPTKSAPMVNSNDTYGLNTTGIQIYGNSPAYYGVQSKTLPSLNMNTYNANNITNNTNGNNAYNPAYSNYGQYYY
jgi:hypothetical protein